MQPQQPNYPQPGAPQQPQYVAGSQRKSGISMTVIVLVVVTMLLIGLGGFAIWAFLERNDYKENTDSKVDTAVKVAVEEEAARKDAEFIEKEKKPTKTYESPSAYGSVKFDYPKTWSVYLIEKDTTQEQINAYYFPNIVPAVDSGTSYALRMKVLDRRYADVIKSFSSKIKTGKIRSEAYRAKNVQGEPGSRLRGEIETGKTDVDMVVIPIRDKTLLLSTESKDFYKDFETIVLDSLTYAP